MIYYIIVSVDSKPTMAKFRRSVLRDTLSFVIMKQAKTTTIIKGLNENEIQAVVMEATGIYLEIKESAWIYDVTRHEVVKNSYIPSRNKRELRRIT